MFLLNKVFLMFSTNIFLPTYYVKKGHFLSGGYNVNFNLKINLCGVIGSIELCDVKLYLSFN